MISGKNNKLIVGNSEIPISTEIPGLIIEIDGDNNVIEIPNTQCFANCNFVMKQANNARIHIGDIQFDNKYNLKIHILYGDNISVIFGGRQISCNGVLIELAEDNSKVIIGDECMLSYGIVISATDMHPVLDKKTKQLLNGSNGRILQIGRHSWIGADSILLKNANIPADTIVGRASVVTKKFVKEFTSLGGNPAGIIKKNVRWSYEILKFYLS